MDFGFTEEQRLLRDSVRKLLQKHAPPEYVRQHDRERETAHDQRCRGQQFVAAHATYCEMRS